MKLSVIVPMYNVEKYVEQCLLSLVNQTYKDMEVIVVDDGSKDGSVSIVERLQKTYPELILVHKANGGLSDARNYGMKYANGEYIAFIDSDDYVELDYYERMMNKMSEGHDVCVCDIHYFYEDGSKGFIMKGLSDKKCDSVQKQALLSPMFAWNKVYRKSFFDELKYPVGLWYEDNPVTTIIFAKSRSIGYVDEALIHYRQRGGSIMASSNSIRIKEIFTIMEMVRNNFEKENLFDTYYEEIEYLHIEHLRLYGMFRFIRSPYFKECYLESDEVMKANFKNWKQNKYISSLNIKNKLFVKYYNLTTHKLFDLMIKKES